MLATPIKALSNQKYSDLVRRHGAASVGLLTGDTTVNPEAPIVVMTTEVLRNMIYASRPRWRTGYVVLDEVHYLADRFRGAVWEEVIIGLADSIQLVALSATVSNAEEFGEWLSRFVGTWPSSSPNVGQCRCTNMSWSAAPSMTCSPNSRRPPARCRETARPRSTRY